MFLKSILNYMLYFIILSQDYICFKNIKYYVLNIIY